MVEENNVTPVPELKTELTFDDQVIQKIAGLSIASIPGILGLSGNTIANLTDRFRNTGDITKGVSVDVGTKQTAIDLSVICEYGVNISDVFEKAAHNVKKEVKHMTGLDVIEFNMTVDDVMTKEQYKQKFEGNSGDGDKKNRDLE
ncbi:MAG: Asp23/Gls24 family envelope stress response protein [Enterococcus sp.]